MYRFFPFSAGRTHASGITKLFLAVTVAVATAATAEAASATLRPSKDTTIYSDADLSNGAGAFTFAGSSGQRRVLRGLMAFNLGEIPAGATITSVTLTLGINTPLNQANTVQLRRVTAEWGEGSSIAPMGGGGGAPATTNDATWTSRIFNTAQWTTPGGDFSSTVSASQRVSGRSGTVAFSGAGMVADVQAWVTTPSANHGWILVAEDERGPAVRFATREGSPAPSLVIDYTVGGTNVAPAITAQPASQTVAAGRSVTFTVTATGTPAPSYQWRKDGASMANGPTGSGSTVSGASTATLTLTNVTAADAGNYSVVVSNTVGPVTSAAAALTVAAPGSASRIINLSILTSLDAPGESFTMGYVVGGNGTTGAKPLVIRAAGPSLGALGVPGTLNDPKFELFAGATKTSENDNWGGSAQLAAAMAAVGAFPYTSPTSLDAAASLNVTTRDNSVKVSAAGTGTGQVIAEVYDATPESSVTATTPRLINVSVLKEFGTGFTAGFVIRGGTSQRVLIRAVGPGLAAFGITSGFVADPQVRLFRAQTELRSNNDWEASAAATFSQVGAFTLTAGSKDAALLETLPPGDYTVQVSGVGGATGIGLVEVYEVP